MKRISIQIQDKLIGYVQGDEVVIEIDAIGFNDEAATVVLAIYDELGAIRYGREFWQLLSEDEWTRGEGEYKKLEEGKALFTWKTKPDTPPGKYLAAAQVYSKDSAFRSIACDTFEILDLSKIEPWKIPAVQRNKLSPCKYNFTKIGRKNLVELFEAIHEIFKASGRKYWETRPGETYPPMFSNIANVLIGYIFGYDTLKREDFKLLAIEGLEYLLSKQESNGSYRARVMQRRFGEAPLNRTDSFYDTGWASLALAEGYRVFKDVRFLDALRRAGEWSLECPLTGNYNFDGFGLWILAPLYDYTLESKYLESAIERVRGGVLVGQRPSGSWPGHNLQIGYQAIIAQGLAFLYSILPGNHPFKEALLKRLTMALNFIIYLQTDDGGFYRGWEYDRKFYADEKGQATGTEVNLTRPEINNAFRLIDGDLEVDPRFFNGLCQAAYKEINQLKGTRDFSILPSVSRLMNIGVLIKWYDDSVLSSRPKIHTPWSLRAL